VASRFATEGELKAAYKQRCLEWHPDKWMDKPAEDRAAAEAKFKVTALFGLWPFCLFTLWPLPSPFARVRQVLGQCLEVLTDPAKRKLYDEGFDLAAIDERVAAANRAAHENPRRHH